MLNDNALAPATIIHHVNTCMLNDNALAPELLKSLYVDDFVSGAKDVNNAFSLSKEIKLCLKSGGFNMTKWNSNSANLLQSETRFSLQWRLYYKQ